MAIVRDRSKESVEGLTQLCNTDCMVNEERPTAVQTFWLNEIIKSLDDIPYPSNQIMLQVYIPCSLHPIYAAVNTSARGHSAYIGRVRNHPAERRLRQVLARDITI